MMFSDLTTSPISFIFFLIALIAAITVHEFAHAYVADRLGDPTARLAGRLTLNPMAHLDPLGTIALLFFGFGWGKPVPFDAFNLQHPRRDSALISFAGPTSNIIVAVAASLFLRLPLIFTEPLGFLLISFLHALIGLNVILAIFNLLPIHPLDGFKVVGGLLSEEKAREWYELSHYGIIFLIMLLFPLPNSGSILGNIIGPPIQILLSILLP